MLTVVSVKDGVGSTGSSSGSSSVNSATAVGSTATGVGKSGGVVRNTRAAGVVTGLLSVAMGLALAL